jgi:hypothetical protein
MSRGLRRGWMKELFWRKGSEAGISKLRSCSFSGLGICPEYIINITVIAHPLVSWIR